METSANTVYTFGMATGEILILLLLAFLAGMLLCWFLRKMGICCNPTRRELDDTNAPAAPLYPGSTNVPRTPATTAFDLNASTSSAASVKDLEVAPTSQESPATRLVEMTVPAVGAALAAEEATQPKRQMPEVSLNWPDTPTYVEPSKDETAIPASDKLAAFTPPAPPAVTALNVTYDWSDVDPHRPIDELSGHKADTDNNPFVDSLLATHIQSLSPEDKHTEVTPTTESADVSTPTTVGDKLAEWADSAKETVSDWTDQAKDAAAELKDKTTEAAETVAEEVQETITELKDKTVETTDQDKPVISGVLPGAVGAMALASTAFANADPHRPIVDEEEQIAVVTPTYAWDGFDPHRPILDEGTTVAAKDTLEADIDPHRPILGDDDNAPEAGNWWENVKAKAQDLADKVEDKVEQWSDAAKDTASDAWNSTQATAATMTDKAEEVGDNIAAKADAVTASVSDKVEEWKDTAQDKAEEIKADTQDSVSTAEDNADNLTIPTGLLSTEIVPDWGVDPHRPILGQEDTTPTTLVNWSDVDPNHTVEHNVNESSLVQANFAEVDPHRPILDDETATGEYHFWDNLKHKVYDLTEKAEEKVEHWAESARETASDVWDTTEATADVVVSESIQTSDESVAAKTEAVADAASEQIADWKEAAENKATELTPTAIALAVPAFVNVDPHRPIVDVDGTTAPVASMSEGVDPHRPIDDDTDTVATEGWWDTLKAKAHDVVEVASDKVEEWKDTAQDKAAEIKEQVQDTTETVSDKVENWQTVVHDKADELVTDIQPSSVITSTSALAVVDTHRALMEVEAPTAAATDWQGVDPHRSIENDEAPSSASPLWNSLQAKAHELAETVSDKVNDWQAAAQEVGEQTADKLQDMADTVTDKVETTTQEAPVEVMPLAATLAVPAFAMVDPHRLIVDDEQPVAVVSTAFADVDPHRSIEDDTDTTATEGWWDNLKAKAQEAAEVVNDTVTDWKESAQETASEAWDATTATVATVSDKAQDLGEQVSAKAQEAAEAVSDTVTDWKESAQETASEAWDVTKATAATVSDKAQDLGEQVSAKAHEVSDAVSDKVDDWQASAQETGEQIVEKAQDAADTASDKVEEWKNDAQDATTEVKEQVQDTSAAAAEKVEQWKDDAQETLADVKEQAEDIATNAAAKLEKVTDVVADTTANVQEQAKTVAEDVQSKAEELADTVSVASPAPAEAHQPPIESSTNPEVETDTKSTGGGFFSGLFHKALESVSHLGERVDHLGEKTKPVAQEWLHKAIDTVEHLGEKVDHLSEKAPPATQEWLHKAKDKLDHLGEKPTETETPVTPATPHQTATTSTETAPLQAESLVKSSANLHELASTAQTLTEQLATNVSSPRSNFQALEGIDRYVENMLYEAGIYTYQQLADASPQHIDSLLAQEGDQFANYDTTSWFVQATLAAQGEWHKLEEYQQELRNKQNLS